LGGFFFFLAFSIGLCNLPIIYRDLLPSYYIGVGAMLDFQTAVISGVSAVFGGVVLHFFRKYIDKSDNADRNITVAANAIETIEKSVCSLKDTLKELSAMRLDFSERLTIIETTHANKGCFIPHGK
jgi:hypothetical protein